jgi:APA family basic amino acid/polyamine antiporter
VAVAAAVIPLGALADATSIGTLFAFALVNVSVIWLRRNRPELERTYRVPLYPLTPILGCAFCVLLMVTLGWVTWLAFAVWMVVGTAVYLGYGRRHSVLARAS